MGFTNPYPASRLTVDSTNSLVSGMQAWFPLTEGTGTSAQCILHPSHTGTLGSSVSWESSEIGTSVVSDGANLTGGINTGNPSSVQITGDLTISAWVKCDSSTPSSNQYIVSKYGTGAGQRAYAIALLTSGSVRFTYQSSGNPYNGAEDVDSAATLTAGNWHFVVGTFQASTAGKIYIDGELDTSNTSSVPSSIFNSSSDVYISGIDDGPSNCFDGNIQNVKIYNRALSAAEIATLYHRPWEGSNYGDIWPYSPPAAGSMTLSTDTSATSIMADIEGWWVMTDGSGTTLTDISGNGRDATLYGTNTWENEKLGTANRFDNSVSRTSHAETANTQPDLTGGYTFSTWVKHEELAQGSTNKYGAGIVLGNSLGSSDFEVYFRGNHTAQHPQVTHNRSNGGTYASYYINNVNYTDDNNVWVNFAVTYDGSIIKIYRDGVYQAASSSVAAPVSTSGYKIYLNELPVVAANGGLTCSMQNTRLWSRALSATEIAVLHERPWEGIEYGDTFHHDPPAPASMLPLTSDAINTDQVGWWPLTETDDYASGAADISGGGNNGTQSGGVLSSASVLGGVASFDGSNDQFDISHNSSYNAGTTGELTVTAWAKFDTFGTYRVIVSKDNGFNSGAREWLIYGEPSGNRVSAQLFDSSGTAYGVGTGFNTIDAGVWYFFSIVWDGTDLKLFVDGSVASTVSAAITPRTSTEDVQIGYNGRFRHDGDISNVRVWSRALTADEIWSIYANPWLGSNYKLASGSTPLYNYIFRTERFRRLG